MLTIRVQFNILSRKCDHVYMGKLGFHSEILMKYFRVNAKDLRNRNLVPGHSQNLLLWVQLLIAKLQVAQHNSIRPTSP